MKPNGDDEVSELLVASPIFNRTILLDFWYSLGIDSSVKIFRVDAAQDHGIRAGMTKLGLVLTNSSSIQEWNRIEHHRVRLLSLKMILTTIRMESPRTRIF